MPNKANLRFALMYQQAMEAADNTYTEVVGPSTVVITFDPVAHSGSYTIDGVDSTQQELVALLTQYPAS